MSASALLESKIKDFFDGDVAYVRVTDESGGGCDGGKFSALIVSNRFVDVPLLDRHKLVNEAIAAELRTIHAWSQKTWTVEQWEAKGKPQ